VTLTLKEVKGEGGQILRYAQNDIEDFGMTDTIWNDSWNDRQDG
jgi:hypothetical protein